SYDLSLSTPLELADGRTMTALEMQWELLDLGRKYAEDQGLYAVDAEVCRDVLNRWEYTLSALEVDPTSLARELGWVAKYQLLDAYRERHSLEWDDPKLAAMDLQYHDVRPAKSLFARLDTEKIVDTSAVDAAITEPPGDTRAYFRGRCLQRWA